MRLSFEQAKTIAAFILPEVASYVAAHQKEFEAFKRSATEWAVVNNGEIKTEEYKKKPFESDLSMSSNK